MGAKKYFYAVPVCQMCFFHLYDLVVACLQPVKDCANTGNVQMLAYAYSRYFMHMVAIVFSVALCVSSFWFYFVILSTGAVCLVRNKNIYKGCRNHVLSCIVGIIQQAFP